MKFIVYKTIVEASKKAAEIILKTIKVKHGQCNLGLATGSSPVLTYQYLVDDYRKNSTSWADVRTFNLDEYAGLDSSNHASYHYFMNQHLFSKLDINLQHTYFPSADDNYDEKIAKIGGIDLQLLGVGVNGHIGFNEPGSSFNSLTRVVDLTPSTIAVNAAKFFNNQIDRVPKRAYSMGIKSIMAAKKIVLLAFGKTKTAAIQKLKFCQSYNSDFPVSALSLHSDVTVILDQEANGNGNDL